MTQRKRVNAKQNAKGEWSFDCTVEWESESVDNVTIANDSLALTKAVATAYRVDGKKIAGE